MKPLHHILLPGLGLWGVIVTFAAAQPEWDAAAETVVLYNTRAESSVLLARRYAELRNIDENRLVGLDLSEQETISREEFEQSLRDPLRKIYSDREWWKLTPRQGGIGSGSQQVVAQSMRVLAVIKGVPLRITRSTASSTDPGQQDEASVDSELAALGLFHREIRGAIENRFYESQVRFPKRNSATGQLLVGRLDAADDATVVRMMEDAIAVEKSGLWGRAVVDFSLRDGPYINGEQWLGRSVAAYRKHGIPVYADRFEPLLRDDWPLPDTIFYFGWYASQSQGAVAAPEFRFKRGAIACHLHSFSAATLRDTKANWCAPLLAQGAAAALGNAWEPYLDLTIHFDIFNARLLEGFTYAEAAWAATPGISWMNVVLGDPLYRPYPKTSTEAPPREDEAYSVYRALLLEHEKGGLPALSHALLAAAAEQNRPILLEFAALLCGLEGAYGQGGDFLQHAKSEMESPQDRLRLSLYEVDLLRRASSRRGVEVRINDIQNDPSYQELPGMRAMHSLKEELKISVPPPSISQQP